MKNPRERRVAPPFVDHALDPAPVAFPNGGRNVLGSPGKGMAGGWLKCPIRKIPMVPMENISAMTMKHTLSITLASRNHSSFSCMENRSSAPNGLLSLLPLQKDQLSVNHCFYISTNIVYVPIGTFFILRFSYFHFQVLLLCPGHTAVRDTLIVLINRLSEFLNICIEL